MKDIEPLSGNQGSGIKPYWVINTPELDELGLSGKEFRVFCHIARRAGPPDFLCFAGIKSMARITRTHPDYVRWLIRHLVHRKLIFRVKRPGQSSHLRICDKLSWLSKYGMDANKVHAPIEESGAETDLAILWDRIWALGINVPKIRWEKRIREQRHLFDSVLADVEERVKRGSHSRYSSDRLNPVEDVVGLFEFTWTKFSEANK